MKIRVKCYEAWMRHQRCRTRVWRGRTQRRAGDAAARTSRRVMPRGFHVIFSDSRRRGFDSGRFARNQADSGLNRPKSIETADSGRNSKKKGAECTIWLISKPYFSPVSHKRQNISSHLSSHFVSHFTCLCALCLSAFVSSPLWLWDTQPLSLLLLFILSSALSHAFLTQVSL